jgi:crotonobetaine/carnitine-CoA ligase
MSNKAPAESPSYLPQQLADLAALDPGRTFLVEADRGGQYTYGETEREVSRWTARLRALGVAAGDPVLVMLPTSSVATFVWIAIARLRAIEAPANLEYRGHILAHVANNSGAKVAIVTEAALANLIDVPEQLDSLATVVVVDGTLTKREHGSLQLLAPKDIAGVDEAAGGPGELEDPRPSDAASLFYTSGTTGVSKGVLVTWKQIDRIAHWYFPPGSLNDREITYVPFPMYHLSGKVLIMIAGLTGGIAVLRERFRTDNYWPDVHAHGCTSTMLLGSMPDFVLRAPGFLGRGKSTLDKIVMNPLVSKLPTFVERFGVRVCGLYGSTEVGIPLATGWDLTPAGTCGRACPNFELRIVDEQDNEVPHGTPGELVVRTDEPWLLMAGYWGMPEATVAAWRNLWFHTGDIMRCDEYGNYFFVDRIKDMIRRRGENISSMELEREILEHAAVLDCAVVGVEGDWIEEEVMAVVTLVPGAELTPAELVNHLTTRVAPFQLPRFVAFLDDLPRTPTGKVRKQGLTELAQSDAVWERTTGAR